jgi:hypothetical protein
MLPRKVDAFAVAVLGDIIDGVGIFPGQPALNNTSLPEQIDMAQQSLVDNVKKLSRQASTFVFMEPGNHGRVSKFGHPHDNHERTTYWGAVDKLKVYADVTPPGDQDYAVVDIEDTTGVLIHKGPPHIETHHQRGKALSELYEHNASWILCAHLHHIGIVSQGFWYFRNGSLMDRGERHAAGLHLYDSPRQICLIIDGDRVIGSFWVEF